MINAESPVARRPAQTRKWGLVAAVVGFLAACAVAVFLIGPPRPRADAPPAPRLSAPAAPVAEMPPPARKPRPENSLWEPGVKEMTFGEFAQAMGLEAARPSVAPVARAFMNAFKSEEVLERVRREFEEAEKSGAPRTAREFLDELYRKPEFRRLAARFAGGADSGVALALAKGPDLRQLGARWLSGLVSKAPAKSPAQAAARAAARGVEPGGKQLILQLARAFLSEPAAAGQTGGKAGVPGTPGDDAGPGAHDVRTKLEKPETATGREFDPLKSAFANLPKGLDRKIDDWCQGFYGREPGKPCDLRRACAGAGVWDDCAEACAKSPPCVIGPKPDVAPSAAASAERKKGEPFCLTLTKSSGKITNSSSIDSGGSCYCCYDSQTREEIPGYRSPYCASCNGSMNSYLPN